MKNELITNSFRCSNEVSKTKVNMLETLKDSKFNAFEEDVISCKSLFGGQVKPGTNYVTNSTATEYDHNGGCCTDTRNDLYEDGSYVSSCTYYDECEY